MAIPAPVLTVVTPSATTPVGGATVELAGTLTFSAGREVTSSSIEYATGQTQPLMITGTAWRVTIPLPQGIEGTRSFTITTIDASTQSTTTTVQLTVDTLAPRLTLTSPMMSVAVGSTAMLSGTVNDASPVPSLTVDVGAGPVTASITGTTWSAMVTFPSGIDRVNRPATISATDAATNVGSITPQLLVDTQGPAVSFMSPAASERLGVPRTQTVTGSVTDGAGLGAVTLNCADGAGPRMATVSGATWTVSWPLPTADNVSSTCTLAATDSLGNSAMATRAFFVDTVAPVVAITSPTANAILGGATTTVAVTATVTDGSNALGLVMLGFDGMT